MSEEIIYVDEVTADPNAKLPGHAHKEGCPQRRAEKYVEVGAFGSPNEGVRFLITHCLDCGAMIHKRQ